MKAIVLAGGCGSKIFPFDDKWQKACIPVGNKANLLRIIDQLKGLGIKDITVVTDYKSKQVDFCLRNESDIKTVKTTSDNLNETIFNISNKNDLLIYYGDVYASDSDVKQLISSFNEKGSVMLLEENTKNEFNFGNYICAKADNQINKLYGHPRNHYVNARTCGIYALEAKLLPYIKTCPETFFDVPVGGMPPEDFFLEQCINVAIEDGHKVNAHYVEETFVDIDLPWDIMFANEKYCIDIVGGLKKSDIHESVTINETARIKGHLIIGENSIIGDNVIFEGNCIIGKNTVIDNGAIIGENCVVGDNSIINNFCKISNNTVIGHNNKIGFTAEFAGVTFDGVAMVHHSQLYGVIGRSTDIAAGCQAGIVRFDDIQNPNKVNGRYYSNKFSNAVFIGDYTRTGIGNIFLPGVKVGSNCAVGPGIIVQKDIDKDQLVTIEQNITLRDWGSNKYGW